MEFAKQNERARKVEFRWRFSIAFLFILLGGFAFRCGSAGAQVCNLDETCVYCGNEVCELGEDFANCPLDCGTSACGDFRCDSDEDSSLCPDDCPPSACGDSQCSPDEDANSCPDDCGCTVNTDCDDHDVCTDDICDAGICSHQDNTASCDDGDACTQTDTCQNGSCIGSNPVICSPSDSCHLAGSCNPGTGTCSNPTAPDGQGCDDGNACSQTDTCQSGVCIGLNPVVCTALDQCHDPGTCDPGSGTCSNPDKPDGSACNDSNGCTQTDSCVSGICAGGNLVTCAALDQCHEVGTCDPGNGKCSNPEAPDDLPCDDGNACTEGDACHAGTCGGNLLSCSDSEECRVAGTCEGPLPRVELDCDNGFDDDGDGKVDCDDSDCINTHADCRATIGGNAGCSLQVSSAKNWGGSIPLLFGFLLLMEFGNRKRIAKKKFR